MKQPKVSILIPVYNVQPFFERCIHSLFKQTFQDIEYVFVNDCTPDNCILLLEETLKQYPERKKCTKIIHHTTNQGIAETRNTLLKHATGEYIQFVDSDDWIEPNMIELMYNKIIQTKADIVGCDYYLDTKECSQHIKESYPTPKTELLAAVVSQDFFVVLWKLLIKKELFDKYHIKFHSELRVGEDSIICLKLIYYSNSVEYTREALYHYVQYNENHLAKKSLENIYLWTKAIYAVEDFCNETQITHAIGSALNRRKYVIKLPLIIDPSLRNLKLWHNLMPEANNTWKDIPMSSADKAIFYLVQHKIYALAYVILYLKTILKRTFKNDKA
ncbi:glycosyltransferase family 2 protein [Bacteroides sp. 224]|uniref:glycosyltransferase family 2 protein n=1 Tax=Bacteroides sp. 224 TaxID=2302936 RepID=UPI0013D837FB|nr:glycosyltransferase family 2 protein [Bacteroides sp. 224]NDV65185.1 glycosyltransferase family 2 protein [Bacteroides sp. 224]